MATFIKQSNIRATPAQVFAWHERPGAFAALTPPWERVEVVSSDGTLQPGSRVVLRTWIGPIPLTWIAEHTECDPPHGFADRQVSGPFAAWHHRHRFLDDGAGGTNLRDEVEYQPPMGWLGRLVGGPMIRRKLKRLFDFRHEVTRRECEALSRT